MSKGTILVVEPDDDIRNMLKLYFSGQGYEISTCTNYDDAFELTRKQLPSLILSEVDLPDNRGWDLIKDLRATTRTSHIPIIILTHRSKREEIIRGLELGVDDYVTKPFEIEELKLKISNATDSYRGPRRINPTSGFPTGYTLEEDFRAAIRKETDWVYIDIKIRSFDVFTAVYDWQAGDEVIKAMALLVTDILEQYGTQNDVAGHPGGAYFVIITESSNWLKALETLKLRANLFLLAQYREVERARGYVLINERENPLMQLVYGAFVAAEHPRDIDIRKIVDIANEDRRKTYGDEPKLDDGIVTEW